MQRGEERLGQGEGVGAEGVAGFEQGRDAGVIFENRPQPVREHRDLPGPRESGVGPAVDLGQYAIEDEVVKLFLAADVAVQRRGNYAEAGGEGAHAQGLRAMGADDREGLCDDAVAGERAAAVVRTVRWVEPQRAVPRVVACCLPLAVHARLR